MENIELMQLILRRCAQVGLTPMIWGRHGIGKSMITRQVFEDLGYEVIDLRLGQLEVGDLVGMPAQEYYCPKCETKYGFGVKFAYCPICEGENTKTPIVGRTVWLPPSWFPVAGEKRCIFFDEFNRGRLDVQQAAFQIVLDRRIHTHKIPDNCAIVCACNPPSDSGSGVEYNVEEIDPALLDRFVNMKFTLTTNNWLKWARESGIMPDIVDFIATEEKFLGNEAIDIPIDVTPSPRSYEFLHKLLCDTTMIPKKNWAEVAGTVIGETAAISFMQSLKTDMNRPIKAADILNKFSDPKSGVKDRVLAQVEAGEGNTRFDLLRITLDEINQKLSGNKASSFTDKQLNNLGDFFVLVPEDLAFSVLKDLALNNDINERLLLKRDDLFDILKHARKGDIG